LRYPKVDLDEIPYVGTLRSLDCSFDHEFGTQKKIEFAIDWLEVGFDTLEGINPHTHFTLIDRSVELSQALFVLTESQKELVIRNLMLTTVD
jgi:hypothetical protein